MSWTPPERSADAAAIYATADADRAARPERYVIGEEAFDGIVERATKGQGASALGPTEQWEPGVCAYLGSAAEDGHLNAFGIGMALSTVTGRLKARLALAPHLADDTSHLVPPIFITGGWRTGTTFLFRLLATDPRLRGLLPSELGAPVRAARLAGAEREAFIDGAQSSHEILHTMNSRIASVHDSGSRLPEECVLAFGTDMRNWGFTSTVRLDAYAAWLAQQDFTESYARYRTMLGLLDGRDGRRFVLKAPPHTAELAALASAFPGAVVIRLHRDIVETIASGASLFATFRSTYSDEVDPVDVGRFQTDQTELWFRRAAAFVASPAARSVTVVDVEYTDLVASPAKVLDRIWAAAGLDPLPDPSAFIDDYNTAQPRHAKGAHAYTPEDFGLVAGDLRERFAALR